VRLMDMKIVLACFVGTILGIFAARLIDKLFK
jgi:hypothetical protein